MAPTTPRRIRTAIAYGYQPAIIKTYYQFLWNRLTSGQYSVQEAFEYANLSTENLYPSILGDVQQVENAINAGSSWGYGFWGLIYYNQ